MGKMKMKPCLPDELCFRWKYVGIIASTEAIWRDIADETKDLLETRGVKVIFRTFEPSVNSDDVSIQECSKYLCKTWIYNAWEHAHKSLQWRHNQCIGSKKTSKLRITGLCEENSPVTGEVPAQRANNAENVSIWWRHHVLLCLCQCVTSQCVCLCLCLCPHTYTHC